MDLRWILQAEIWSCSTAAVRCLLLPQDGLNTEYHSHHVVHCMICEINKDSSCSCCSLVPQKVWTKKQKKKNSASLLFIPDTQGRNKQTKKPWVYWTERGYILLLWIQLFFFFGRGRKREINNGKYEETASIQHLLQNMVILPTGRWKKCFPPALSTLEQPFCQEESLICHTTDEANIGIAAHAPLRCFLFCRSISFVKKKIK